MATEFGSTDDEVVCDEEEDIDDWVVGRLVNWESGSVMVLAVGVAVCDGGDGSAWLSLSGESGRLASDDGGVAGNTGDAETRDVPLVKELWGDADLRDGTSGDTALSSRPGTTLLFLLARPVGGGFMANSCASGVGGGRKEEEGDGKGEEDGGTSTERDTGR
jgi:hypothetical protein